MVGLGYLEFHTAKFFIGQDIRGINKSYDDLKRTYQIAILASEKFFLDKEFFHTFEYYDSVHGVSLNGMTQIITLELMKLDNVVEKPIKEMSVSERVYSSAKAPVVQQIRAICPLI